MEGKVKGWLTQIYTYNAKTKAEKRFASICTGLRGKITKLYSQSPQDYYKDIKKSGL